jgi:nanoRNase/pAp phosphatase (c-di-AMP/oligoRNAs hydrolase)
VRVAIVEKIEKVENSLLAARVMGVAKADVAVVIDKSGKISLRSRGVNIRDLAVALGGGGHVQAAGAKIDVPLSIRIASVLRSKALVEYVVRVLIEHADYVKKL